MYVLPGTEKDYSHVTQSGFFLTVQGTEQDTVVYAGDRWADFAWNGLGYNQWVPLSGTGADVRFDSLSEWDLNARTGEWQAGSGNNWILNPDFAADRIAVSTVTGWTQVTDPASSTTAFVSNPSPGADGSRFALRLGAAQAFSGGVQQENDVPAGVYALTLRADNPGGLSAARVVVTGADGTEHATDIPVTSGWADVASEEFVLPAGTARVAILATGPGGRSLTVDALSLRRQGSETAVRSIAVTPSTLQVPVGSVFDPAAVAVTATLADGTTRVLGTAEYTVTGFDTVTAGIAPPRCRSSRASSPPAAPASRRGST
ncbi:bacterial Ig-like domain-containing protein [Rathayibacter oskolensis]|uniref:bacterial Ig-like domain-containing protein n=1 Tax=Rathayibacter oskolensis TaxID=1891671 RepID=UPI0026604416|nr:bacterial Ig-like domain-containing protein [Rathayibacter oskolensis]WKK72420.1 bacterial Ig-like domain-containing protein [Rathayibacter oskolensis]